MAALNLFNASWYLAQNPDVAEAVRQGLMTAEEHFQLYGNVEGRAASPLFNPQDYLANNPDVAAAVEAGLMTAYDHFAQFGVSEGRSPLSLFDPDFYLAQNPDVAEAVAAGLMSATEHFLLFGQGEPRQINPLINLGAYMNANADLAAANAEGLISPFAHLLTYGAAEGRDLGNGVNLGIFANDPAFQNAVSGGNLQSALVRAGDVAPFLPTFQAPPGWAPPANTPIPTDFTPPAGTQLVIPPTVVVPPGTELPPSFEPVTPPAPTPPAPTPGGGGGGGGTPTPTFTVTNNEGVLQFTGTATGDITVTSDGTNLTFTRGGVAADTKPKITELASDTGIPALSGGAKLVMTAGVFNQIKDGLANGAATVNATGADATALTAVSTGIAKVDAITSLTLSSDQSAADITALLGKTTGALVTATTMTGVQLAAVAGGITNVADDGITGTVAISTADLDEAQIASLLGAKTADGATVNVDAASMTASELTAVSTGIAKVDAITSLTLSSDQSAAEITALLGKTTGALVTATTMTGVQLAAVAGGITNVADDGITGTVAISTADLDEAQIASLLGAKTADGATVNVDAASMTASELTAVSTGIAKVDAITNLTLTNAQSDAEIGNLLGKATNALVTATDMNSTKLAAVVGAIDKVAADGITGTLVLNKDVVDTALTALLSKTAVAATVNVDADQMTTQQKTALLTNLAKVDELDKLTLIAAEWDGVVAGSGQVGLNTALKDGTSLTIEAGVDNDTVDASAIAKGVTIKVGGVSNVLTGGVGNDTFIIDGSLEASAGLAITGGDGTDVLRVTGTDFVDLSTATALTTTVETLDLTTDSGVQNLTLTAGQLNAFSTKNVDASDMIAVKALTGATVAATSGIDTFVFDSTDINVTVTGFTQGTDKIELGTFGALTQTPVTGDLTTTEAHLYILTGLSAGEADTADAVATKITGSATWTHASATAYIFIAGDNSSALYKWVDTADAGVQAGELTLIGTVDAALTEADLQFST